MTMPSYCCPQTVKRPLKSRWEAAGRVLSLRRCGMGGSNLQTALSGAESATRLSVYVTRRPWGRWEAQKNPPRSPRRAKSDVGHMENIVGTMPSYCCSRTVKRPLKSH
jgi:hypothetical protein